MDTLVIDFETKKSFAEVGGEQNKKDLGISVAGVYSYAKDAFFAFEEHEIPEFERMLKETEHIIGFNLKYFDLPVIEPYMKETDFADFMVTDMFKDAEDFLGHRIGLNALAKATLRVSKSGHGLEALQWFREGKVQQVKDYCLDDVRITRDLYEYGKRYGHMLFESNRDGKLHSIPVSWRAGPKKDVRAVMKEAFEQRKRVRMEYVSSEDNDGKGYAKERLVDVHTFGENDIEAFCHLRGDLRKFRFDRMINAEITEEGYTLIQDHQGSLF